MPTSFSAINTSKANFEDIYTQPDPRAYYSVLGALDYMIPDLAAPVVRQLLSRLRGESGRKLTVLDLGCSYGINAALQRFPLSWNTLRRRYTRQEISVLDTDQLRALDRHYFASWPETSDTRFLGLDISENAIDYAREVKLIDQGIVADLEQGELTPEARELLRDVDVVLTTGCVGYITDRTFRKLMPAFSKAPWVISFVLRMFPYRSVANALADYGLATERLAGATFVQRRFRDEAEFARTLGVLRELGVDPAGVEAQGLFHAELFLSRPEEQMRAAPLSSLVVVASGLQRPVGIRYVRMDNGAGGQTLLEP